MPVSRCHNIEALRRRARRRLPKPIYDYIDGGSDDEVAYRRNTAAFDDYELLPSQLTDVSSIDTATTLFGRRIEWPVMLSPTGASKLFHRDGELAVARAAEKAGTIYSLSTLGTTLIEDVAAEVDCPLMYQVYVFKDRGLTREFIERCRDAGYAALCLTVDTAVGGNREKDIVNGLAGNGRSLWRLTRGFALHPGWLYRAVVGKDLELVNVTRSRHAASVTGSAAEIMDNYLDRTLTWKDVEWLRERWDGPLVIKGIQTVDDCRKAADAGATAVMLSNHGGRQLESAPAPVDCIAAVADALSDRLEIICDGGIRRGNHIVKALALGASACSVGRVYLYGLAAGGQPGAEHALAILRKEFERTLALVGCNTVERLDRTSVGVRRR